MHALVVFVAAALPYTASVVDRPPVHAPDPAGAVAGAVTGAIAGNALFLYVVLVAAPSGALNELAEYVDTISIFVGVACIAPFLSIPGAIIGAALGNTSWITAALGSVVGSMLGVVTCTAAQIMALLVLIPPTDAPGTLETLAIYSIPVGIIVGSTLGAGAGAWAATDAFE